MVQLEYIADTVRGGRVGREESRWGDSGSERRKREVERGERRGKRERERRLREDRG
jgi:hypothetical protein